MSFCDVAFLSSRANFSTIFLNSCGQVKASTPPHVIGLWLRVIKGMLPVEYFCSYKASFCVS